MKITNIFLFSALMKQAEGHQLQGLRGLQQVETQSPGFQEELRNCISIAESSHNDETAQCSGKREVCDGEQSDFKLPDYNDNITLEALLSSQTNCIEKERQCNLEYLNELKSARMECADNFANSRDYSRAQQCTVVAFEIEKVESEACVEKYKVCEDYLPQYLEQSSANNLYSSINADKLCQEQHDSCTKDINDLRKFTIEDCNEELNESQDIPTPEPTFSPYQENTQGSSNGSNGFLTEGIDNWMIYALGFSVSASCLACLICCNKNSRGDSQRNSPVGDDDSRSYSSRSDSSFIMER